MKKIVFSLMIICLLLSCIAVNPVSSETIETTSSGSTLYVDDDYDGSTPGWGVDHFDVIQDAINASNDNDTVYVYNGTYYENLITINKEINLVGENRDTVIVEGSETIFYVTSDNVRISSFSIIHGAVGIGLKGNHIEIIDNFFDSNTISIIILTSNEFINIKDNLIKGSNVAITIKSSNNNISGNTIEENGKGIIIDWPDNTISNNTINNNNKTGIVCYTGNNNILNNVINNNGNGIRITYGSEYKIIGNTISNNKKDGIYLNYCWYSNISRNILDSNGEKAFDMAGAFENEISHNHIKNHKIGINLGVYGPDPYMPSRQNDIHHNNFLENEDDVNDECWSFYSSRATSNNSWNNNYWDKWIGLEYPLLDFVPYCIHGRLSFLLNILFKDYYPAEYDENPASKPYDVNLD